LHAAGGFSIDIINGDGVRLSAVMFADVLQELIVGNAEKPTEEKLALAQGVRVAVYGREDILSEFLGYRVGRAPQDKIANDLGVKDFEKRGERSFAPHE
jgi:hypothetical protein